MFTIHAPSFGDTFEDIGQELDSWQAAMSEANELWPGSTWRIVGDVTELVREGRKVCEIHEVVEQGTSPYRTSDYDH